MEEARAACAAQNGKVIDLDNYIDSFAALAPIFADFRIMGSNEATCWEDGDGNKVQTDVSVRTSTTLVFDTIDFPSVLIAEISTLPLSSICEQDVPEEGEVARLMIQIDKISFTQRFVINLFFFPIDNEMTKRREYSYCLIESRKPLGKTFFIDLYIVS